MSKRDDKDTLKTILRTITIITTVVMVLKTIVKFAKSMDRKFEWRDFVGEDMEAELEKWEKKHPASRQVRKTSKPSKPASRTTTTPKPRQVKPAAKVAQGEDIFDLNDRQEKIFEMVKQNGEVTMQTVSDRVSDVSERTLRRDMNKLEKLGLIERFGKTKDSVYKLKK